ISRLYSSRPLDAAYTSALNLLKKGLLVRGKLRQLLNGDYRDGRDLPRDIPLDSVVVLRYEKRSKSEIKGKVPTEMELVLEQTQQGTSYEVSVSAEGVEELKRKVKIKGEKKEALLTLRQKSSQYIYSRLSRSQSHLGLFLSLQDQDRKIGSRS
ncbi:hypothetical protein Tco_0021747, partial [Tanacetum coccineum]